jgi:TorA maturation chaperone TorD
LPTGSWLAFEDAMATDQTRGVAEQAFWHTLAQAWLPPMEPAVAKAFVTDLPDDIAELADAMALEAGAELAALRSGAAALATPMALLVEYSRLFLPPASCATPNLSRYVDSGVGGPCMDALELAYQSHGLEPSDALRDFADHAARQFEFMGHLAGRDDAEASRFAQLCLVGALPRWIQKLHESAPLSPYTALARIAAKALQRHRQADANAAPDKPKRRHDHSLGVWRHCDACGRPYAREKEIAIMATALERAGLPAAHLSRCPDCRDRAQGFFRREVA